MMAHDGHSELELSYDSIDSVRASVINDAADAGLRLLPCPCRHELLAGRPEKADAKGRRHERSVGPVRVAGGDKHVTEHAGAPPSQSIARLAVHTRVSTGEDELVTSERRQTQTRCTARADVAVAQLCRSETQ